MFGRCGNAAGHVLGDAVTNSLPDPFFQPHSAAGRAESTRPRTPKRKTKVAIARGLHLFPFRTEKLNPATPMILRKWKSR